jgi:putative endonuclease
MREFYVYILASRPGGALYVGVTNNLARRVFEHKNKMVDGHTKRYGIDRLVYFTRRGLIAKENATWRDLYDEIAGH